MDNVLFTYDEKKNPEGTSLPGVPLADVTVEHLEGSGPWLLRSIDAHPAYTATKAGKARLATDADADKKRQVDEKPAAKVTDVKAAAPEAAKE